MSRQYTASSTSTDCGAGSTCGPTESAEMQSFSSKLINTLYGTAVVEVALTVQVRHGDSDAVRHVQSGRLRRPDVLFELRLDEQHLRLHWRHELDHDLDGLHGRMWAFERLRQHHNADDPIDANAGVPLRRN